MRPSVDWHRSEEGSAMIACIILSFVLLAGVVWFSSWTWDRSRADVPVMTAQRAMQYADSCVNSTSPWLKDPKLKQRLPPGTSGSFSLDLPGGHCDVDLFRRSGNAGFVDTFATGYYYIATGGTLDSHGQRCQTARINAKFTIYNVSEYLSATPGLLPIANGTDAGSGMLYGGSVDFGQAGTGLVTKVDTVYYFNTVTPSSNPSWVQFPAGGVPNAQKLAYAPTFASLDPQMNSEYQAAKSGGTPALEGTVGAPPTHVYFYPNALEIGQSQPLVVQGVYVVYVASTVLIHNSITLADSNSWIAILSEDEIRIAQDAPDNIQLSGNYICNGLFRAEPVTTANGTRTGSRFSLTGGVVTMTGFGIGPTYVARTYTYKQSNDSNLLLPNITNMVQYTVLTGGNAAH